MCRTVSGILVALAVVGSAGAQQKPGAAPAGDGAERDLAMIQGTWEHEVRDRQGKVLGRVVKHVQGKTEMVIHERADGKVTHAHRVDVEVLRAHGVRVFRFSNGQILEGPNKGQKMDAPGAYVYRVTEEAFTEVTGFMVGQEEQPVTARVYKRVKDRPEAKSDPKSKDEDGGPKDEGRD